MGELSQGSGPSGNAVIVTIALFKTLMSESSCVGKCPQLQGMGRVWDAILVTVDGLGGLM